MNPNEEVPFETGGATYETMPQARVSRITIDRLYNLGSYEHVKYSLTIDLPDGSDLKASSAFIGAERILEALNPSRLKCCKTELELKREALRIQETALMPDDKFHMQFAGYTGTRQEIESRIRKSWQEDTEERQTVIERAAKARQMLDDLGGASQWKDAKLDWEDYDE